MRNSRRLIIGIVTFILLGGLVFGAYQYQTGHAAGSAPTSNGVTVNVTAGGDRGPGSLREALFVAASANEKAIIAIKVPTIALTSALPPLVNAHGMSIVGPTGGVSIDGRALRGAVFDVAGANVTIQGVIIHNCPNAGILLRAARFRLSDSTIDSCDVGVDTAENASALLIEGNKFTNNRVGLRFASSIPDANIVKNEFSGSHDASIWAVRSTATVRATPINVRDNRFLKEPIGILDGNIALLAERNEFRDSVKAAVHVIGEGATVRGNRITGGAAMGVLAENARGAVIENNEIDHVGAYGVMIKNSANTLVRSNRLSNCAYGMAFVLGDIQSPSTAVDNTIIEPNYNGIDVIGESPILRRNHVLHPRVMSLSVQDFNAPGGRKVIGKPFLDNNSFDAGAAQVAAARPPAPVKVPPK